MIKTYTGRAREATLYGNIRDVLRVPALHKTGTGAMYQLNGTLVTINRQTDGSSRVGIGGDRNRDLEKRLLGLGFKEEHAPKTKA